jgi:hypothetical protein
MTRKVKEIQGFEPLDCLYERRGKINNFLNKKDGGILNLFLIDKTETYKSMLKNIEIAIENNFDFADVIKMKTPQDILVIRKIDFDYFLKCAMEYSLSVEDYRLSQDVKRVMDKLKK